MRYNLALRPQNTLLALLAWLTIPAVFIAIGWWWTALGAGVAQTADDIAHVDHQVQVLQNALAEMNRRAEPRRRALALRQELNRYAIDPGVLRRMETAAPDDVWLTSADLSGGRLTLDGRALSWSDIARFVTGLAATPGVTDVALTSVSARGAGQDYDFHVLARLIEPGAISPDGRGGGGS